MTYRALAAVAALFSRHAESMSFQTHPMLDSQSCSELKNEGTHFSIDVEVGTPPQMFSVIADTGSNTLIIPSCSCMEKGRCPKNVGDRCFTGTNKSTSFFLEREKGTGQPVSMVISFGSGQVQGVVAKEQVKIGQLHQWMDDGLLLMTDRALNTKGSFGGILGLGVPIDYGPPPAEENATAEDENATQTMRKPAVDPDEVVVPKALQEIINKIVGNQFGNSNISEEAQSGDGMQEALRQALKANGHGVAVKGSESAMKVGEFGQGPMRPEGAQPKGFLEQAKIDRFSMCFNDGGNGALRIGTKAHENSHGGIGKAHWGLDFRGISVGKNNTMDDALFCIPDENATDQATPCGAVPDSGTTMLMGPGEHVAALLESICDEWDRCAKNYTALLAAEEKAEKAMTEVWGMNPFNMKAMTKGDVMQFLLADCESWMHHGAGLNELPDLHFHIVGSNGTTQALKLRANAYVLETRQEEVDAIQLASGLRGPVKNMSGAPRNVSKTGAGNKTGKVCSPAFGSMEFNTQNNGPIWILGTPLFYEYVVGYDAGADPPSMAFSPQKETPCGHCHPEKEPLKMLDMHGFERTRPLRRLHKTPRMPNFDFSKGL